METTEPRDDHAKQQARAQYESIAEMVQALKAADDAESEADEDETREAIQEHPLSIETRSGWAAPGAEMAAEEYKILLCTGGPAVQIVGELDEYKQPTSARIQYQDWFTNWTDYHDADEETLLYYAQQFYFGE